MGNAAKFSEIHNPTQNLLLLLFITSVCISVKTKYFLHIAIQMSCALQDLKFRLLAQWQFKQCSASKKTEELLALTQEGILVFGTMVSKDQVKVIADISLRFYRSLQKFRVSDSAHAVLTKYYDLERLRGKQKCQTSHLKMNSREVFSTSFCHSLSDKAFPATATRSMLTKTKW